MSGALASALKGLGSLASEAVRVTRATKVPSVLTAFLSAAVVSTTLLTTGQTATMEAAALAPLGSPATRLITITDDDGRANISSETVAALASLTDVEAVLATGTPNDLRMGTGRNQYGAQVALVTVYGNVAGLPDPYPGTPSQAVWLGHDAQGALGWTAPFGTLADSRGREYAVMGGFRAAPPFEFLDGQAITRSRGELYQSVVPTAEPNVSRVYLLATSIEAVPALEHAVPALVRAERRTFTVTAATDLIKAREVVSQALTQPSRALMLALLGGGLLLQAATMFAMVYGRRRDFGRRRALGASRSAVAFLVIVQAMLPAAAGVLVALTVGTWASGAYLGSTPPWSFIAGVGALAVLESALAALVPALMAVRADPVRLLRVP